MIAKVGVISSKAETATTRSVRFTRPKGFHYRPVQFVGLELETKEGRIEYSMSLASSPTQEYLEFGARMSGTPWKEAFRTLRPGDEAEIDGPYGHFILDEHVPAVLLAGGIGITPLKGMAAYATHQALPVDVVLAYANRTPDDIAFKDELAALAAKNPRLRIHHTITRPQPGDGWTGAVGHFDEAFVERIRAGLPDPKYYISGPPGMIKATVEVLARLGVSGQRVLYEPFWGY